MEMDPKKQATMPYWGADARMEDRPGVPREPTPHRLDGAHWRTPEHQTPRVGVLVRAGLGKLTPVFGTCQPPHGLSGRLRRSAYRVPDWRVRHWLTLRLADRIDVLESGIRRLLRIRE